MELFEYEREHSTFVRANGAECTVLLKKDGSFPLKEAGKIALYGSGGRRTIMGGTGSGEVNSRYRVTVEEGLQNAGFTVTSRAWLDGYEQAKQKAKEQFIRDLKAEAKQRRQNVMMLAMGRTPNEPEYDLPLDGDGDTAVYVLSRISGEGADRTPVGGDILLSHTEIRDILDCNKKYQNFVLVLNTGGPVDLTPVMEVRNILLLSQLGAETGNILADILLGKQVPSGKLTTTWASWEAYPALGDFGEKNDTRYQEGIYVGYRYFDSAKVDPLFPFGFGLSYTDFQITEPSVALNGECVSVSAKVKNNGTCPGKEVVQLYISIPAGKLDEPYQVLCGFAKTKMLNPGEEETVTISFAMHDIAPYDEETASYILESGDYVLRCGSHSRNTSVVAVIHLEDTAVVLRTKNVLDKPDFADWKAPKSEQIVPEGTPVLHLSAASIPAIEVIQVCDEPVEPEIEALSQEQLIKMNLGAYNPKAGPAGMIGNSGFTVAGAAGQTCMEVTGIPSMVMADGPAGLRLNKKYAIDPKGEIHSMEASIPASLIDFMSKSMLWVMSLLTYKPKKRDMIGYQYATAIPIGTAIAQSFNTELAQQLGRIVGNEMKQFGVHLWLAPALNIHRSIRCGRNFEYYSEDPFISGVFAGAITRGVQSVPNTGVTIKHYAFNNQERNRTQNNSQVSERAAREIYLKGFGICVKKAQPKAVMTSYNLVNGIHTNEHIGLIRDVLRSEFGFEGIVMTDWIISGYENEKNCLHPVSDAARVCMAGGDLFMPGSQHDYNRLQSELAQGTVTKKQLQINASRVCRMAKNLTKE